jgi:hypothetical protein
MAVAVVAFTAALAGLVPASWGEAAQEPSPESGVEVVDLPQGTDETIVHSWALAPAGSTDPTQPGNRPILTYEAAPGATIDDAVTLFNYSNVQLTFRIYATDAFNNEDGAFDLLPGYEEPTDAGSWVTLPQGNITVPAQSQATMPITLHVPPDASPGDHAGAVLASSVARGTGPDGKVVDVDRRTGSVMYIRVDGELTPELAIENVETTYHPSLNPLRGTADVTYRIQNRGNVRLSGRHSVSISGPFGFGKHGKPVEDVPELLPGDGVTVRVTFEGVPAGVVDFTKVHLDPSPIEGDEDGLRPVNRGGIALALPITVILVLLALGLARYARRRYVEHGRALVTTAPREP